MSDTSYIYGDGNGASFTEGEGTKKHTNWDPRLSIRAVAGTVEVGIVPPDKGKSTDEQGVWDTEHGQFIGLSRDGLNRLIRAARECRDAAYGKDE